MLVIVAVITLLAITSAVITGAYRSWSVVPQALSLLSLWSGYLYTYMPRFRILVVQILARFTSRLTRMRLSARFAMADDVDAQEIADAIRQRYRGQQVKIATAAGRTMVHVKDPGFQLEYTFSKPLPAEMEFDDGDNQPTGYVLFTVPDTKNSVDSARSLVSDDILPLFEAITQAIPLRLEALEITIYFAKSPNPYLPAYVQHVEVSKLTALDIVVTGDKPHTMASIKLGHIALSATSASDLRYMMDQHLGFEWAVG